MKKAILIGLLWSISTSISYAQSLTEKLDQLFESAYNPTKSGAAILISKDGKTIYQNQIGLANVEYQIPISTTSKFHIGSITKQFTAAGILLLEEEGKLAINDPISKYLPSIPADKKMLTIAQLLTHTSGFKDYPQIPEIRNQIRNNLLPKQVIAQVNEVALEFEPGTELSYSNSGYMLLGVLIEAISGQDYGTFLENRIFKILDMNSTSVNNYEAIVPNRAIGYSEDENDQLIHATFHTSPFSAGAIISTVEDLNKWAIGLYQGNIISKKSLKKMLTNNLLRNGQATDNGFGWEINKIADMPCFEHSGFVPGYKSNSIYIPEQNIYVVVMQNNEYGSPTPTMINAAALVSGNPYPGLKDAKQLSEAAIKNITGTYELEGGEERIIYKNEDGFHIKALGGQTSNLYASNENTLFYKEGYRQISFKKSKEGKLDGFIYKNRGLTTNAIKTSDTVPEERNVVQLDVATLGNFVGAYEFEPFKLAITLEGQILYIQPDGSNKVPMAPFSSNAFLIEEIGAEITFKALAGESMEASLLMEGNILKGLRKR